jgi:predicted nucleic acid-binding protein
MAIVYFDSSALVKLVVQEDGSEVAAALWDGADAVVSSGVAYPEIRAALAVAHRDERISTASLRKAKRDWGRIWDALAVVESHRSLLIDAGDAAERYGLRGYDAVHLASALAFPRTHLLMAAWGDRLRGAAIEAGLSVAPVQI